MRGPNEALMLQLLEWLSSRPRSYAEAMEAWRSSCPRHPVWEDALEDGLIQVEDGTSMAAASVTLTARGLALISEERGRGERP